MTATPKRSKILVTSALPYANGPIHLGHLAGAYLPSDIFVRYHRLCKNDIVHICGSDENGVPIMLRARSEGKTPQQIVDHFHAIIKKSFQTLGIHFDYYGRTSSQMHYETSQDFFKKLHNDGVFKVKKEKNLYDPEANLFLADRFIYGECPSCGFDKAYGDQCENCGKSLSPDDLIHPKSAITNAQPVKKETTHWYIPLADFQQRLADWIETKRHWKPNVLGQVKSWLKEGLKDRAVTRDLPWGVPVPADIANEDSNTKVIYVWFDAPIGYISATKEWALAKGEPDLWKKYWQQEDSRLIHFIGKDNIVFHCLMFPAMLMAHGNYVLPESVPANEFLNLEGDKLSTSRNYAVWLHEYLQDFDPDTLRYTLAANMPEQRDADFSWKELQSRHNNELADILGNLVNRTFTFINRYFAGKLPVAANLSKQDEALISKLKIGRENVGQAIDRFQFKDAVKKMMDVARFANKYFNDQEPWQTRKSNIEQCGTTLNLCAQAIHALAILINPVLPFTSNKIWRLLKLPGTAEDANWQTIGQLALEPGREFAELEILFQKIEDTPIQNEIEKLQTIKAKMAAENNNKEPEEQVKPQIAIDDFAKLKLQTAKVLEVEKVKGTDRLLKLQVDLGKEKRQIVSGIAKYYEPEELVGKTVVIVANLKPVKLRGELSQGMILTAEGANGDLAVISPEKEIEPGSEVR